MQNIDKTTPHIYQAGLFSQCKICKLSPANRIHILERNSLESNIPQPEQDIEEIKQAISHYHTCVICARKHYCENINCTIPLNFTCDCTAVPGFSLLDQVITANSQPIIKCIGHTCIQCKKVWMHDYQCNKPANMEAICKDCSSQNAVIANRPEIIKEIEKNSHGSALSGAEQAEAFLTHEAQVNLMIHDASGNLLDNWNEIIVQHLEDFRKIQAKIKIHEQATYKVRAKVNQEEFTKLTPEEQEQYKREALKPKRKTKEVSIENKLAAYNKVIANSVQAMMQANPKMTQDQAIKRAVKIFGSFDESA